MQILRYLHGIGCRIVDRAFLAGNAEIAQIVIDTVEEAADVSGFKYSSLLQWMHEGIVPFVQVPGKKRLYIRRDVLLALIEQWQQSA